MEQIQKTSFRANGASVNIDAHYSDNMKVKRPKVVAENINIQVSGKSLYSDKEANEKLQKLNTDIYESHKKEKANHEFNFKTFFKIIAGFVIAAAGIAGIRELVRLFRK